MYGPPLPAGTRLGKYVIIRLIGAGGMGAVYEGTHLELRKRVAIKTLLPALMTNPEALARFLREGEAASRIDHPNVVNVTDVGTEGQTPFLVMEFLDGENLSQRLAREGGLPVPVLLDVLLPVVDALAAGHAEGVVHRDLKPQNIFLARSRDGRLIPKLLDFGVSKLVADDPRAALTDSLAVLGTAQYMAPEQIDGPRDVDARTDQYAMGLVLFEGVTGRPARQGLSPLAMLKNVASEPAPSLRAARPDVDADFAAVVARALRFKPGERYPSMRELLWALLPFARPQTRAYWTDVLAARGETAGADTPVMPPTMLLPEPSGTTPLAPSTTLQNSTGQLARTARRRSPARRVAFALVALGLVTGGALFWRDREPSQPREPISPVAESQPAPPRDPAPPVVARPPARQRIEVRATPADATIAIDGQVIGHSPVATEVAPGAHELVVASPGYQTLRTEFSEEHRPPAVVELIREPASAARNTDRKPTRHRSKESAHAPQPEPPPAEPVEEPARRGVNDSLIIQ